MGIRFSGRVLGTSLLANMLTVGFSVFLMCLAFEGVLRIQGDSTEIQFRSQYPEGILCQPDPWLGWIGRPSFSGLLTYGHKQMEDVRVTMNSEGFWDNEHSLRKSPLSRRLLFLGDSFTIGYGTSRQGRFTDSMKSLLPPSHEIINMGMWGYGVDQTLLTLMKKGIGYAPDVVVTAMFVDDLFSSHLFSVKQGRYLKPKFKIGMDNSLELVNVPLPDNHGQSFLLNFLITRYYLLRNRLEVGTDFEVKDWFSIFDRNYMSEKRFTLSLRILSEMHSIAKGHGSEFLVVLIPYKDQVLYGKTQPPDASRYGTPRERFDLYLPQKVVTLFCEKSGIPLLDLLPAFRAHPRAEDLFFVHDLHWTREGHFLAAKEITKRLQRLAYLQG